MAEFVEYRVEEMIPELEKMEQLHLFDKSETRTIAKRRKEYEYKIQRRTKCKDDYLRYIQYEMDLLKLIRLRREKMGITKKKADIEFLIANRVNKLFKQAIQRFREDVRLWISYIKFCKQMRFYSYVSRTLVQMLEVHSDNPNLWRFAANWEFEESQSVENARQFLLRGLRFHPESRVLYTEAFRLELQYAGKMRKQQQEKEEADQKTVAGEGNSNTAASKEGQGSQGQNENQQQQQTEEVLDQVLKGGLAEMIYETAIKKINDVQFLINLLEIAKEYDFTSQLQSKMLNYLLTAFGNNEMTWDTLARRKLEGLPCPGEDSNVPANTNDGANESKLCLKDRIKHCCEVYSTRAKVLPTEKMWSLYMELLLELNQDQTHLPVFKKNLLREAFEGAHSAGCMQEKYYLLWVDMLKLGEKFKKLKNVLKTATKRLPLSVELWQVRLRFHLSRNEEMDGLAVFQDAVAKLGSDDEAALPLWKIMLQYYQTKDMHKVEQVFQDGIIQGPAISLPLKPLFIEWLVLAKGIVAARKVYDTISIQPPLCLELHTKMAALESYQPGLNMKYVRRCHEMACEQFGKDNTDVWIEYVKFEQKRGDAKRVSDIHIRAVKNLDPLLTDNFVSEFSLIKTGMSVPMEVTP